MSKKIKTNQLMPKKKKISFILYHKSQERDRWVGKENDVKKPLKKTIKDNTVGLERWFND